VFTIIFSILTELSDVTQTVTLAVAGQVKLNFIPQIQYSTIRCAHSRICVELFRTNWRTDIQQEETQIMSTLGLNLRHNILKHSSAFKQML
jgi:hypothetical protein